MGQFDILELLEKNPTKWFNYKQIALRLDQEINITLENLRRLRKFNCVETKLEKQYKEQPVILYKYKKHDKPKRV